MATDLSIEPELIEKAVSVSGAKTKKAAVTQALKEFIARREQKHLIELFGMLEWDKEFDYKIERSRDRFTTMGLLVDTGVWSFAFPREPTSPSGKKSEEVSYLASVLESGEMIFITGLVLQELLQGFAGPKAGEHILERFAVLQALHVIYVVQRV